MRIELSSKEIAEKHNVSERTAFRWMAANDERCFVEIAQETETPEDRDRREADALLRKILDDLAQVSNGLGTWVRLYDDSPRLPHIAALQEQLFNTMDKLQKKSGLYPETNWNE